MTIGTTARHGPDLPYQVVAGVTPCGPSWLVAPAKLQGTIFAPEEPQLIAPFSEVLDQRPTFDGDRPQRARGIPRPGRPRRTDL